MRVRSLFVPSFSLRAVLSVAGLAATLFAGAGCNYTPVVTGADGEVMCPPAPLYVGTPPACDMVGALCTYPPPTPGGCSPTCRCVQADPSTAPRFVCQPCGSGM